MQLKRDVALTFAGGGNRAFYQMGLLQRLAHMLTPRLGAVAAVSAGACVAVVHFAQRHEETRSFWMHRRQGVTKNFEWKRLLAGKRPTPHGPIYRDTVIFAGREGGLERIRALPFPLLVLTAAYPRLVPGPAMFALGGALYTLERRLRPKNMHPSIATRIGLESVVHDARDCESPEELADLVIASSATPPFTPMGRFRDRTLLDGGLIDAAPAHLAEAVEGVTKSVVLLTRSVPHAYLAHHRDRLYLSPRRPVAVSTWDYTRPERVDATIRQGVHEAALHEHTLATYLGVNGTHRERYTTGSDSSHCP